MIDFDFDEMFCASLIIDITSNHIYEGVSVLKLVKRNIIQTLNSKYNDFRIYVSGTTLTIPKKTGESVKLIETFKSPVGRNLQNEITNCLEVLKSVTDIEAKKFYYISDKLNLPAIKKISKASENNENLNFYVLLVGLNFSKETKEIFDGKTNVVLAEITNPTELCSFFGDSNGR